MLFRSTKEQMLKYHIFIKKNHFHNKINFLKPSALCNLLFYERKQEISLGHGTNLSVFLLQLGMSVMCLS